MQNVIRFSKETDSDANALEKLMDLVGDDMVAVNNAIISRVDSHVSLIPELSSHLIRSGGKRLRPLLTLATSRLCGYEGKRHIELATCIEFVHTATLLHDDVVDESDLRRGQTTANTIWGNPASVLVGDYLFGRSFQIIAEDGSLKIVKIMADTSAALAEGEVLQLTTSNNVDTSEEAYLQVISAKTAALFSAACRIGAVVADRPEREEEALGSYGRNLGIAFQLVDDALDYSAHADTLGKTVGDDFREGKITLPAILAYRRGGEEERAFWRKTLENKDQNQADLKKAIDLMTNHNTLRDTVERARHYGSIAKDALGIFPDGDIRHALGGIIDFCIERAY